MEESIKRAEELIEATNEALARLQHDSSLDDFSSLLGGIRQGKRSVSVVSPRGRLLDAFSFSKDSIRDEGFGLELLERELAKGVPASRTTSDTNLSTRTVTKINVTEDLKAKLKETQEVVDRGIQTARELNETVEVLRSSRQSKTEVPSPAKTESLSSVKTAETKRCKRCNAEITRKTVKQKKEDNVLVTRVRGMDSSSPRRRHHLNYQQLPSLKIQGDLSCQRIPSVDIPPGKRECFSRRANASYEMYSHEEIVGDGMDKIIREIKKRKECSNCGKIVRPYGTTEEIDELLKMCDYNVFDPRIDEFVERLGRRVPDEAKYTQTDMETPVEKPVQIEAPPMEIPKRRARISDLSSELTRKYREKATELESEHLEFEGILRELFQKMDESRSMFKNCDYLNTIPEKRKASLSVTPPVLLSYTGSGEEADDGRNAVLRPRRTQKSKLRPKEIRKKLERKELEVNCKLISSSSPAVGRTIHNETPKPIKPPPPIAKPVSDAEASLSDTPKKEVASEKPAKPPSPPVTVETKPSPPPEVDLNVVEESIKQTNTVSDYESDFEEESAEEKSPQANDNSYKYNARLSTISEIESELDRKISDLAITPEEKEPPKESRKSSGSSSDDDDTRKLLRKVNRDLKEVASQQLLSAKQGESLRKVPEDVAEPLKEVLNALKNQFERTEQLADKLTESIKDVKKPEGHEIGSLSNGHRDLVMVNNLQRARKFKENGSVSSPRSNALRSLREKSAREKEQEEVRSLSSTGSVSSKVSGLTGKSYSEGEISEQEILASGRSSPSIGEVINEHSDGSLSEEKSVIKFL